MKIREHESAIFLIHCPDRVRLVAWMTSFLCHPQRKIPLYRNRTVIFN